MSQNTTYINTMKCPFLINKKHILKHFWITFTRKILEVWKIVSFNRHNITHVSGDKNSTIDTATATPNLLTSS